VLAPLTRILDYPTARWVWLGFSILCTMIGLFLVWRTSRLQARGRAALALLPFLALLPPTTGALGFGQLSPQLFLVAAAAYAAAIDRYRSGLAGFFIAVGTYLKSFPGVIGIYLLARRDWRGCFAAVAAGLGLVLISLAILGWQPHWDYLTGVIPAQRRWFGALSNVAFTGVFTRLFSDNGFTVPVIVAEPVVQAGIALCSLTLLLATGYGIARALPHRLNLAAAFGLATVAALLLSPINGSQNLLIAALPLGAAVACVQADWPRGLRWLLIIMLLLTLPVEPCDLAPFREWCVKDGVLPIAQMPWRLGWGNLLTIGPFLGLLALWAMLFCLCQEPQSEP
jgi:hypothetical protein